MDRAVRSDLELNFEKKLHSINIINTGPAIIYCSQHLNPVVNTLATGHVFV